MSLHGLWIGRAEEREQVAFRDEEEEEAREDGAPAFETLRQRCLAAREHVRQLDQLSAMPRGGASLEDVGLAGGVGQDPAGVRVHGIEVRCLLSQRDTGISASDGDVFETQPLLLPLDPHPLLRDGGEAAEIPLPDGTLLAFSRWSRWNRLGCIAWSVWTSSASFSSIGSTPRMS